MWWADIIESSNMTLQDELIALRKKIWRDSNGSIEPYEVFTNKQLANIMKYLPKNKMDLLVKGSLRKQQVENYGTKILEIIEETFGE